MRTLLYLKKLFIETYGEVPKMIGFLGLDTDRGEYSKSIEIQNDASMGTIEESEIYVEGLFRGHQIMLDKSEQVQISVEHPQDLYRRNIGDYAWLPQENSSSLRSLTLGAGQVRSNGRFAFVANSDDVEQAIDHAIVQVGQANAVGDKYELIDNKTDVYLIFSLGGGTGSGIFIDVAYTVRRLVGDDCKLAGFIMLPEVFRAQMSNGVGRVRPNAYGAVMDLEWLMTRNLGDESTIFTLPLANGRKWTTHYAPFDACIFVDNKNRNLDTYTETRQIEEMIARTLITSVGELSVANVSVLDNIAVGVGNRTYDVRSKRAWVSGMGVCEVHIQANELRKIYAHRASIEMVNQLLNKATADSEANQWIDMVKIREHEADDLIDYLLPINVVQMPRVAREDYGDIKSIADNHVASQQPNDEELNARLQLKKDMVADALRTKVIESLRRNQGQGIGFTEELLSGILAEVQIYLKEMTEERGLFEHHIASFKTDLNSACIALQDAASGMMTKLFGGGQRVDDAINAVCDSARNLAVAKCEIVRRVKAAEFYNDLIIKIKEYQNRVSQIRSRLETVVQNSRNEIAKLRNKVRRNPETFQINISGRVAEAIPSNIVIADFIASLSEGNKIYDFYDIPTSTIGQRFMQYAFNLPEAKEIGSMDINKVLTLLKKSGKLEDLVRDMVDKASPLLLHNFLGYTSTKPKVNYYIGVSNFEDSELKKDDFFETHVDDHGDVMFSNIGMKDRIIIFSQMNPIPAFAVSSLSNQCKREYVDPNTTISFHIDANILKEMKKTGFTLEPGAGDNILELWVKGFIHGLIRCEKGVYQMHDEEHGDIIRHYWVDLSDRRDEAFRKFKEYQSAISNQFKQRIQQENADRGSSAIEELYQRAKIGYLAEFSQCGYNLDELASQERDFPALVELIRDELEFVRSQL